jgi:hypothetical protein
MRVVLVRILSLGGLALVSGALGGCPKKKAEPTQPSASASAEPAPAAARPAQPPPPDVDAQDLAEDLGCDEKAKGDLCRIVSEFAAGEKWKPTIPSGRGVWVGTAHQIGKDKEPELIALRAKTVPTAQVGPSDLPLMIGFEPLPEEHLAAGAKLVRALQRGGQGKLTNPALPFLEDRFIPQMEFGAMQTEGTSTKLLSNDDVYIRKLSLKKIALVKLDAALPGTKDVSGMVAELWSAVW